MLKVRVFKRESVSIDKEELELLLDEAGCVEVNEEQPVEEDVLEVVLDEQDEDEDFTLIVILTPECVADPDLDEAVGKAVGSGGRAVGVWPKGSSEDQLPAILDKVGSGTVAWDPKDLASVLTDSETVWNTPAGEPRPVKKTKRNKC